MEDFDWKDEDEDILEDEWEQRNDPIKWERFYQLRPPYLENANYISQVPLSMNDVAKEFARHENMTEDQYLSSNALEIQRHHNRILNATEEQRIQDRHEYLQWVPKKYRLQMGLPEPAYPQPYQPQPQPQPPLNVIVYNNPELERLQRETETLFIRARRPIPPIKYVNDLLIEERNKHAREMEDSRLKQ
jgi:hypothetical protein